MTPMRLMNRDKDRHPDNSRPGVLGLALSTVPSFSQQTPATAL